MFYDFLLIFLQDVDVDFRQMIWKNQPIHTDAVQQLGCYSEFGQTIGRCTRLIESGKKTKSALNWNFNPEGFLLFIYRFFKGSATKKISEKRGRISLRIKPQFCGKFDFFCSLILRQKPV